MNETSVQLHCISCKKVTWHRTKIHNYVCNTCDTSKEIKGSNISIPVNIVKE